MHTKGLLTEVIFGWSTQQVPKSSYTDRSLEALHRQNTLTGALPDLIKTERYTKQFALGVEVIMISPQHLVHGVAPTTASTVT